MKKSLLSKIFHKSETGIAGAALTLFIVFSFSTSSFLTNYNMFNLSRTLSLFVFIALSQAMVLVVGGMNLSVGAIGGLATITAGYLMQEAGVSPGVAVVAALAVGVLAGAFNGLIITKLKINSFVVTLSTMFIFTGLVYGISKGYPYTGIPKEFTWAGKEALFMESTSVLFWFMVIILALVFYFFKYTFLGRSLLATGANREAAILSGINADRTEVIANMLSGLFAATAGVLYISRLGSAQPATGEDWLIISFAVAIIGGTGLNGGKITAIGLFFGGVIMVLIKNGLIMMEANVYFEKVFLGMIILLTIALGRAKDYLGLHNKTASDKLKTILVTAGILIAVGIGFAVMTFNGEDDKTKQGAGTDTNTGIAWYASAVHPYFNAVQKGVDAYEKAENLQIKKQIGQDWTQDNENQNVEALAAKGYKAFAIYPSDSSAVNGLIDDLHKNGRYVVTFGTAPLLPTKASFYVATDVKQAAINATEHLIKVMGGKGNILNVLEVISDANTVLRKQGIEEVVAKYPNVQIIQEVADMKTIEEATEKIQNAMAAKLGKLDGIICTGYTTTVAATGILKEHHQKGRRRIRFVGIDDDKTVLDAIRDGHIDATLAQNPYGHGYLSCLICNYLIQGWTPKDGKFFVNAGMAIVEKSNVDSYQEKLMTVTKDIAARLETEYLIPPKKGEK